MLNSEILQILDKDSVQEVLAKAFRSIRRTVPRMALDQPKIGRASIPAIISARNATPICTCPRSATRCRLSTGKRNRPGSRIRPRCCSKAKLTFELNLTRAYPAAANLRKFSRKFEWEKKPQENQASLDLTDLFEFVGEGNRLEEVFISLIRPELSRGSVRWTGQRGRVALNFDPELFKVRLEPAQAYAKDGELIEVFRLCLESKTGDLNQTARFTFGCNISD